MERRNNVRSAGHCRRRARRILAALLLVATAAAPAAPARIDLVPFGRVVRYEGNSPETLQVRRIERGDDGWTAWKDESGEYMIGLEWDEPRDVSEIRLEFRDAFPNRDRIRVQYFHQNWPTFETGGWAPIDDPFHGKWITAPLMYQWAGERDVNLPIAQLNEERIGPGIHGLRFRRTYRIRLLLGPDAPPPIRAIAAYAVQPATEEEFDLRIAPESPIRPPLKVEIVNGVLLDDQGAAQSSLRFTSGSVSLRVRYLAVDVETPTRTVVTVRSAEDPLHGFSFLPQEAQSRGILKVPALGVSVVARHGLAAGNASLFPGQSITDRVEREPEQTFARVRRDIPPLHASGQRGDPLYLPLGPPEARQEIAVSYDGSFFLHRSALKSSAADSARLHWPAGHGWSVRLRTGEPPFDQSAEGVVKQRLLDGFLPIVISSWETGGVRYEETCVATFLNGEPAEVKGDETVVLLARVVMTNRSNATARATIRLRTDPGEALQAVGGHVSAVAGVGDKPDKYPSPRNRFFVRNDRGGEMKSTGGERDSQTTILFSEWQLAPGESRQMEVRVPFITLDTDAEREQIAALDFDRVLRAETERWRKIIAQAATIEVPNQLVTDFYKASLAHVLITGDRDPLSGWSMLSAGTWMYGLCLNEACHQIRSLEMRGLHAEAQKFLDAIVAGQSSGKMDGRFTDATGVLRNVQLGTSEKPQFQGSQYNLDHGFGLWMLNEHYRFTRDRVWLAKTAPALIAACDFVTRQRNQPPGNDTLEATDTRWGLGLLPPGHLEDPPEWHRWFSVNAYACRGMLATAESLREIGHPEAARIERDAKAFLTTLRDSCREAMVRAPVVRLLDGTYVPHQPTRSRLRGRDLGWVRDALYGPVHLIDCGIYADDSPEAGWILRDTEDNVFVGEERGRKLTDFDSQWFSWGGITIQANLVPNPLVYARRGQPKLAVRAFFNVLATFAYEDVRAFTEHPVDVLGLGEGPFYKSADESAFVAWFRSLLICEYGQDLELLPAVPLEWLGDGKEINVRGAATWFGPMNLRVACKDKRMDITVELPKRNPPRETRIHLRRPDDIRSVFVNGRTAAASELKAEVIVIPAGRR